MKPVKRNNKRKHPENDAVLKDNLNEFSAVAQSANKVLTQIVNKQKESNVNDKDWDFCKHLYNKIKDIPEGYIKDDLQLDMQQLVQSARKKTFYPSSTLQRGLHQRNYAFNDGNVHQSSFQQVFNNTEVANVRQQSFQQGFNNTEVANVRQQSFQRGLYGTDEMQHNEMQSNSYYQRSSSVNFDNQQSRPQSDYGNACQSQRTNVTPEDPNSLHDSFQSSSNQYTNL